MEKMNTTLALLEIFQRYTSKDHPLTVNEIIEKLTDYDIVIDRRVFYREYDKFLNAGLDIVKVKNKQTRYYYNNYSFSKIEAVILMDILGCSKVLTDVQYDIIIDKVHYTQTDFNQNLIDEYSKFRTVRNRRDYFQDIDLIISAINEKKKISFKMLKKNPDGTDSLRKGGKIYTVEPYHLAYKNDNYYVIGKDDRFEGLSNYRLDHMTEIEKTIYKSLNFDQYRETDFRRYLENTSDMFQGERETIRIRVKEENVSLVFDLYHDVEYIRKEEGYVYYDIREYMSDKLIYDLISRAGFLEVTEPQRVRDRIGETVKKIMDKYE